MVTTHKKFRAPSAIALGALALGALLIAPIRPAVAAPPAMGVNLEGPGDASVGHLYTDMFRQGRHFGSVASPWDEICTEDSNGWPTTDAGIVLSVESSPVIGTYKLTFTGQATLAPNASSFTIANQVYNSGTNVTTADINMASAGNIFIDFTATKRTSGSATNTGITNARLIRPGYPADGSVLFTSAIQTELSKFSVIRFMDFSHTNNNTEVNWTDRRLPSYATQCGGGSAGGGAWEYAVALCNAIGKDMYINIPMHATDAYITSLANVIKNGDIVNGVVYPGLNAGLNAYIEYSNEIWNNQFQQTADNHTAAQAEVAAGSPLNYDGDTDSWDWTRRRTAKRTKEISDLFRAVFGDAAMPGTSATPRIRPVMEWQGQNGQNTAHLQMSFLHNYYNNAEGNYVGTPHPVNYYIYGGGSAPYYNSNNDAATTVDLLYASGIPQTGYSTWLVTDANWSKAFGVKAVDYEGGWNIGTNNSMTATQLAAHEDPRAATSIINASNMFSQAGGDLEVWYASCGSANWVWAMTSDPAVTSQLISGINTLNGSTAPAPTNGSTLTTTGTTTIQAANCSVNDHWYGAAGAVPTLGDSDLYKGFFVVSPSAATYQVQLSVASPNTGGQMRLYVDSVLSATITVPNTGSPSTYTNTTQVPITLSAGMHGIVVGAGVNGSLSSPFAGNFSAILIGNGTITIPPAPAGLTGTGGYGRANLNWSAASGATSYNVYRGTTAGGEAATAIATGILSNSYTNTGLTNGTTYYYKVTAVNSAGESGKSNEASVVPVDNAGHILQTATAPVIDGTVDAVWSGATAYSATHVSGTVTNGADLSATWKGLWDSTNLYLLANVTDDVKMNDSVNAYDDDAVEVFIDGDNSKGATYDGDDIQYVFGWNDTVFTASGAASHATGVTFAEANPSGTTYVVEVKIPWTSIGDAAVANNLIGIDVHVDDDDDGGSSDGKLMWNDTTNSAWNNPSVFGFGLLQPTGGGAPAAPTGLTATAGNTQVTLSWTASSGATSYNVLRSTVNGSGYASVATGIATTSYTNTGLTNGTTYYFVVTATNAGGTSGNSNQASATPAVGSETPLSRTGWVATASQTAGTSTANKALDGDVATWWDSGANQVPGIWFQLDMVSAQTFNQVVLSLPAAPYNYYFPCFYAVYVSNDAVNWGSAVATGSQSQPAVTTISFANQTARYLKIQLTQNGLFNGNGWIINEINVYTGGGSVPPVPTGLTATPGNAQVALSWTASTGATAYDVKRSTVSGSGYVTVSSPTVTNYTNTGLTNGTTYYFVVDAKNASGTSGNSSQASATPVGIPAAPTGLTATLGNTQIALSWTASGGATSYNVKRSTVSGSGYVTVSSPSTTSYTNTGLTNGTTYYFVVTAVNTAGESANSSQVSGAPYAVAIKNTASAPVIDGTVDAAWSSATAYTMANNIIGTAVPAADISGTFKCLWDATNLYVLFQITDDVKKNDSVNAYDDDAVEVFLDGNYSHGATYDNVDDVQYVFGWGDATFSTFGITGHTAGITFAKGDPTGTTYVIEIKFPWSTIGGTASTGRIIGFDGHIDDDDDGAARDNALAYSDTNNTAWSTPSVFAAARLN